MKLVSALRSCSNIRNILMKSSPSPRDVLQNHVRSLKARKGITYAQLAQELHCNKVRFFDYICEEWALESLVLPLHRGMLSGERPSTSSEDELPGILDDTSQLVQGVILVILYLYWPLAITVMMSESFKLAYILLYAGLLCHPKANKISLSLELIFLEWSIWLCVRLIDCYGWLKIEILSLSIL